MKNYNYNNSNRFARVVLDCTHCGKEYIARSPLSQYCSTACRSAAHRARRKAASEALARIVDADRQNDSEALTMELKAARKLV